jgi:hypothetical protein
MVSRIESNTAAGRIIHHVKFAASSIPPGTSVEIGRIIHHSPRCLALTVSNSVALVSIDFSQSLTRQCIRTRHKLVPCANFSPRSC